MASNAAAVRRYLEALEANKPRRGRRRTPESIQKRLDTIEESLTSVGALQRLALVQERLNLKDELRTMETGVDLGPLETEFVKAAKEYGSKKGITYSAWREMGVSAQVLKAAGIAQTRRRT